MMRAAALALVGLGVTVGFAAGCSSGTAEGGLDAAADAAAQHDRKAQDDAPPFVGDDAAVGEDAGPPPDGAQFDAGPRLDGGGPCYPEPDEAVGGDDCHGALDRGSLSSVTSSHLALLGNLWPDGDVDWYKVTFVGSADPANCDKFNARVSFAENPFDHFRFEVQVDACTGPAACGTGSQTGGLTKYTYTRTIGCPCGAPGGNPSNTSDTVHECHDDTMTLRIRVFRAAGAPALCENYVLSVDNG